MNTLFSFIKKSIGAAIMAVLLFPAMVSGQYIISVSANNAAWGTVSGGGNYALGQTFSLTATPNQGYEFVEWSLEGSSLGSANPLEFELDDGWDQGYDYQFLAVFRAIPMQYNLNIIVRPVDDAGTVDGAG